MNLSIKHICIILLGIASNALQAQDSPLLLGKWQLVEMQQDSILIFNRDNVEITLEEARNRNKLLDSVEIQQLKEVTHPLMKKMFYEFKDDGNLIAGVLDLEEGRYIFVEKPGGFEIDGQKLGLHISGGIDIYIYSLEGITLTLIPFINGEIYRRGYAKYERLE